MDFFCFGWTRLLLLHLHLGSDPGWPLFLATRVELASTSWGASTTRCPSTSAAVHRCCALRSRWRVAFLASPAAHRCRRSNSATRRSSFAPVMLLGMLLLRCLLSVRAVLHGGPDDDRGDILGWPWQHAALRPRRQYTGAAPFGLGGALSFGFAGAHRCRRPNSAIRRPSFVPVMFHCELLLWCPSFSP